MALFFDQATYERCPELEVDWAAERDTVPGYFVKCKDGNTYLVFAPDMDSLKHMHCYHKIMKNVGTRMTDHDYDPVRKCIDPAWSNDKDEYGDHKIYHAPASEMGKVYLVIE